MSYLEIASYLAMTLYYFSGLKSLGCKKNGSIEISNHNNNNPLFLGGIYHRLGADITLS